MRWALVRVPVAAIHQPHTALLSPTLLLLPLQASYRPHQQHGLVLVDTLPYRQIRPHTSRFLLTILSRLLLLLLLLILCPLHSHLAVLRLDAFIIPHKHYLNKRRHLCTIFVFVVVIVRERQVVVGKDRGRHSMHIPPLFRFVHKENYHNYEPRSYITHRPCTIKRKKKGDSYGHAWA